MNVYHLQLSGRTERCDWSLKSITTTKADDILQMFQFSFVRNPVTINTIFNIVHDRYAIRIR